MDIESGVAIGKRRAGSYGRISNESIAHCSSLSAQCDGGPSTATLFSPLGTSILGTVTAF